MKKNLLIILIIIAVLGFVGCLGNNNVSNHDEGNNNASPQDVSVVSYRDFLPQEIADLPEDFYPAGLTREKILAKIPQAVKKTGEFFEDETWSGVILVTGDIIVKNLIIEPGTIVFIEADKDDQGWGEKKSVDPVNPHEFLGENYSRNHIWIRIDERLTAKGTPEKPIIITSTAEKPGLADWDHLQINKGVLEYALVESCWGVSVDSSDATVSHCLIRNMLQQGVMFGSWPEAGIYGEPVSPNIMYNFMYNFGHMGVQSFFSEPYIAHNVFIQKHTNNSELYEYLSLGENGGLDIHGGNGTIEYNFVSYGYNADLEKESLLGGPGVVITEATAPVIRFNTIVGNKWGIELQGGIPVVNNNNIYNNEEGNLVVRTVYVEPGKEDETMVYDTALDFTNNYWGTIEKNKVIENMNIDEGIEVNIDPISTSLILDTGPDWNEFEWLYK